MSEIKNNILKFVNKLFHRTSNYMSFLPSSQCEIATREIVNTGIIKDFEREINTGLNLPNLDSFYGKRLENEKNIYNLPLDSKLSETQTIELAKQFFSSLGKNLPNKAEQIIENKSSNFTFTFEKYGTSLNNAGNLREAEVRNFSEVYCPKRGDLRDLYGIVHEVTHTFDLKNGDTESRKIFGEIAPQCMERMLDEFLLNLSDEDLKKYGLNRNILIQDVRKRQVSTFLSRKDNTKSFNNKTGNQIIDLRYALAQIYSYAFMKQDKSIRTDSLITFIKNIENNDIDSCNKAFGIDFSNKFRAQLLMSEIINSIRNTHHQIVLQEEKQDILEKSKSGENFDIEECKKNTFDYYVENLEGETKSLDRTNER